MLNKHNMPQVRQAYQYLTTRAGYTPAQASGVVANLLHESNLNPKAYNPQEGAHGIMQWRGDRYDAFTEFKRKYSSENDPMLRQLAFLTQEGQQGSPEYANYRAFAQNTAAQNDPRIAAQQFARGVVRPAPENIPPRLQTAQLVFDSLGNPVQAAGPDVPSGGQVPPDFSQDAATQEPDPSQLRVSPTEGLKSIAASLQAALYGTSPAAGGPNAFVAAERQEERSRQQQQAALARQNAAEAYYASTGNEGVARAIASGAIGIDDAMQLDLQSKQVDQSGRALDIRERSVENDANLRWASLAERQQNNSVTASLTARGLDIREIVANGDLLYKNAKLEQDGFMSSERLKIQSERLDMDKNYTELEAIRRGKRLALDQAIHDQTVEMYGFEKAQAIGDAARSNRRLDLEEQRLEMDIETNALQRAAIKKEREYAVMAGTANQQTLLDRAKRLGLEDAWTTIATTPSHVFSNHKVFKAHMTNMEQQTPEGLNLYQLSLDNPEAAEYITKMMAEKQVGRPVELAKMNYGLGRLTALDQSTESVRKSLNALDSLEVFIQQNGGWDAINSGTIAPFRDAVVRLMDDLGIPLDEGITNATNVNQMIESVATRLLGEVKLPGAVSNYEHMNYRKALATSDKPEDVLKFLLSDVRSLAVQALNYKNAAEEHLYENSSMEGFDAKWLDMQNRQHPDTAPMQFDFVGTAGRTAMTPEIAQANIKAGNLRPGTMMLVKVEGEDRVRWLPITEEDRKAMMDGTFFEGYDQETEY